MENTKSYTVNPMGPHPAKIALGWLALSEHETAIAVKDAVRLVIGARVNQQFTPEKMQALVNVAGLNGYGHGPVRKLMDEMDRMGLAIGGSVFSLVTLKCAAAVAGGTDRDYSGLGFSDVELAVLSPSVDALVDSAMQENARYGASEAKG